MNAPYSVNRRQLLQTTGFLALSFTFPSGVSGAQEVRAIPAHLKSNPMLSSWLRVNADKSVTLFIGKVELGQGALTALGQICADELGVHYDRLHVISGDTALSPNQGTTSGSQTMSDGGTAVQEASAEVREILFGLAAAKLGAPVDDMKVEDGVITAANGRSATYWELVTGKELERKATGAGRLRPLSQHRYIGTSYPRVDIPAKITGGAIFVQDMKPKGTVFGAIVRPPTYKASLVEIDISRIEKMTGVIKVVRDGSFLGIVAEREDQAFAAASALGAAATWDVKRTLPGTEGIFDWLTTTHSDEKVFLNKVRNTSEEPVKVIEASYYRPYHMHGSIGTSAAIAQLGDDGVMTIHTHSQNVFGLRDAVAELLSVDKTTVRCIHTQGSGCYGHNMADDAATDAALLAAAVPGKPVKLQYTRAQEHQWEPYGSAMVVKIKAGVGGNGNVLDWRLDVWSTSHATRPGGKAGNLISSHYVHKPFVQPVPKEIGPPTYGAARNGIALYDFPGQTVVSHFVTEMPLRVSSTRSLGAYANVFAVESFIDQLAHEAGVDSLEYRLRFLKDQRARDVLTACAGKFGWAGYEKKENRGRGIAFARYKNLAAFVAVAIEVEVNRRNGRIRVLRAVAADDSGQIVNPDGIRNQVEGGIIQSLSWTLKEEVKFDNTGVLSHDWASYPIITFSEVPQIDVVLVDRPGQPYLGTGEAPTGPTAAALANAVFDASRARLRRIPFTPSRVKEALDKA
jgi:CO/xanthine dehydrogenase Mo-binding subunit